MITCSSKFLKKTRQLAGKLKWKIKSIHIVKKRLRFYGSFISKNDLCFDVGANYGNRTSILLKLKARVVACEPQQSCYEFLRKKYGKKINLVTKGLGDSECEKTFYLSDNSTTLSSFDRAWIDDVSESKRFGDYTWSKSEKIKITTLDNLIREYGIPHFIKIDVEGYELEVLNGLSHPVNVISFEYAVPERINRVIECVRRIQVISANALFNYSIGESMLFASKKWLTAEEMIATINSTAFIDSDFGDIYASIINMN